MRCEAHIAVNTLLYNRKQYTSLFAVCVASVAIMLSAVCVADGMLAALSQKARLYYGGDLQLMAGGKGHPIKNIEAVEDALQKSLPATARVYERFDYDASDTALFFQGESVRQRMFKGVDFAAERGLFSSCTFTDGDAEPLDTHDTIVISDAVAKKLGVRAGDAVTLQIITKDDYTNTVPLVVKGISQDSSLFGMYTSYIDIKALRHSTTYPDDYVNRLCIHYNNPHTVGIRKIKALQASLGKKINMFPLTADKEVFFDALDEIEDAAWYDAAAKKRSELGMTEKEYNSKLPKNEEDDDEATAAIRAKIKAVRAAAEAAMDNVPPMYALITIDANINDLRMLTDAMSLIVAIIIAFLVAIISVGIASTYRVIVLRRTVEIGTYRALGMARHRVRELFVVEAVELLVSSFIAGLLLAALILMLLFQFDFSFIPAFDMFLSRGHILPAPSAAKGIMLLLLISVTTVLSVLFTVRNIIHISPVGALSTTT